MPPPKRHAPLTHSKDKGEWGELAFQAKALALGLSVTKPNGDNQPFDFHVTSKLGTFRIQVKSTWKLAKNRYCSLIQPKRLNPASGFDYVVVYIAPMDVWYIMPARAIPEHGYPYFFPHDPDRDGPYEKYRNRWSLLTGDPLDDTREVGLTIHAAADPGDGK